MTVCLTGDVHHMSMATRDQEYLGRSEAEVAVEYAEIAASYDVPVTLFVTGRTAREEPERIERLAAMEDVEVGGHDYWAFDTPVHMAWRAVEKFSGGRVGSWNGPRPFQRYEIHRTVNALSGCGVDVRSWRDHAYRHDHHTGELVAEAGITHFSDEVGPGTRVRDEGGLTVVPVNTPPDHEHMYHAFRTAGSEAVEQFDGPFGGESVDVDRWVEWVTEDIESIRAEGGVATILAHPACMWITDEFDGFERLVESIADERPRMMQEIDLNQS